jgi:uncharacterized protein (TIGR01244 family)
MIINKISSEYSVSSQICADDFPDIVAAGFKSIICNRPDTENPTNLQIETLKLRATAAGLEFAENEFGPSTFGMDKIDRQAQLLVEMSRPVLAYCASGNRCSIIWAFAKTGMIETNAILEATEAAGFQLSHLRPQLEALALSRSAN